MDGNGVLSVVAALLSGVNTVILVRVVFRAGVWFGEVNTRLDNGEKSHAEITKRLARLEELYLNRGVT